MAEWQPHVRRRFGFGATLLGAALVASGCQPEGAPLLLEYLCGENPYGPSISGTAPVCTVTGDAELTTGVTGDAAGVHFGSGTGALTIRLNAIPASYQASSWSLEALAASTRSEGSTLYRSLTWGTCSQCPANPVDIQLPLNEDFGWARIIEDAPTLGLPDDATFTLRGAEVDLIDLRSPGTVEGDYYYY